MKPLFWIVRTRLVILAGAAALTLSSGCDNLVRPSDNVDLQIQGRVTDATSGAPVNGAKVALVVTEDHVSRDLTSVRTDSDGRYAISFRLTKIVTEKQFRDSCSVWGKNGTTDVTMLAQATGFVIWSRSGDDGAPPLRCTGEPQVIDLKLRSQW
jgi:hypothetical protein